MPLRRQCSYLGGEDRCGDDVESFVLHLGDRFSFLAGIEVDEGEVAQAGLEDDEGTRGRSVIQRRSFLKNGKALKQSHPADFQL